MDVCVVIVRNVVILPHGPWRRALDPTALGTLGTMNSEWHGEPSPGLVTDVKWHAENSKYAFKVARNIGHDKAAGIS